MHDMIKCIARSDEVVSVTTSLLKESAIISQLLDVMDVSGCKPIPIPGLTLEELQAVDAFFTRSEEISDIEFFESISNDDLLHLMESANYLACGIVLEGAAVEMASRLEGKSRDEMREMLHIENDFTAEEEATVVAETSWAYI